MGICSLATVSTVAGAIASIFGCDGEDQISTTVTRRGLVYSGVCTRSVVAPYSVRQRLRALSLEIHTVVHADFGANKLPVELISIDSTMQRRAREKGQGRYDPTRAILAAEDVQHAPDGGKAMAVSRRRRDARSGIGEVDPSPVGWIV